MTKVTSLVSIKLLFASIICMFFFKNVSSQDFLPTYLHKKVDSIVFHAIQLKAFPGAVILAMQGDTVLFKKAYGYHTYDSIIPVNTNHLFDLASITKVTAATPAIMKLYEAGLIDLDEPIGKYLREFKFNKRGKATIRELLAHQGGWKSWIRFYEDMKRPNGMWKRKFLTTEPDKNHRYRIHDSLFLFEGAEKYIIRKIKKAPYSPNQGFVYSDLFFYLVPELVKRLTGEEFEQYISDHFYRPLEATTLTYNPQKKYSDTVIVPTEIDTFFRNALLHAQVHDEGAILVKGVSGHAGIFGNADDLAKLWSVYMNDGLLNGNQYFQPQTIRLFTTTQYPNNKNRRALGFDKPMLDYDSIKSSVSKDVSVDSYGHTGFTGTFVWADPVHDFLIIFLSNRVYPTRNQRAIYDLNVRPAIQTVFYEYLLGLQNQ